MKAKLFTALMYVLPHHATSRLVGYFVESKFPLFKNALINWAIRHYDVDMSEAKRETAQEYKHFNDFFTRSLKVGARPLPDDTHLIVSPADGEISQIGQIQHGRIFQAKGHDYSLLELLGNDSALAEQFADGSFATIYLAPKDYHRVHMPAQGLLQKMIHVPGRLFSVSKTTVENVPRIFARNERVISVFETEHGSMAVIMVGAINVASIETVWAGLVTPNKAAHTTIYGANSPIIDLERGTEMGRFKLGSTAIVLFGKQQIEWLSQLQEGSAIRMGEAMAQPFQHNTFQASSAAVIEDVVTKEAAIEETIIEEKVTEDTTADTQTSEQAATENVAAEPTLDFEASAQDMLQSTPTTEEPQSTVEPTAQPNAETTPATDQANKTSTTKPVNFNKSEL